MTISKTNYYWGLIKDLNKFFFVSLIFGAILQRALGDVALFPFLLAVCVGPFLFTYYAYMDKQVLAATHTDSPERHWGHIAVFMVVTGGLYAFAYMLIRYSRYSSNGSNPTSSPSQSGTSATDTVDSKTSGTDSKQADATSSEDKDPQESQSVSTSKKEPDTVVYENDEHDKAQNTEIFEPESNKGESSTDPNSPDKLKK